MKYARHLLTLVTSLCLLVSSVAQEAYVRVKVEEFPRTSPINQPIVLKYVGSEPVRIFWFTHIGGKQVEIVEARGEKSYTPTIPGWYLAWLENDHYGSTANGNLLPYSITYLGNNSFSYPVATVKSVPSRWTLVQ